MCVPVNAANFRLPVTVKFEDYLRSLVVHISPELREQNTFVPFRLPSVKRVVLIGQSEVKAERDGLIGKLAKLKEIKRFSTFLLLISMTLFDLTYFAFLLKTFLDLVSSFSMKLFFFYHIFTFKKQKFNRANKMYFFVHDISRPTIFFSFFKTFFDFFSIIFSTQYIFTSSSKDN